MPAFSQATLEQIRSACDIVEVVGSYLPLKRAGSNFKALCPFHTEKTPSFTVTPGKQIFYCFGCHKGGDVFAFVREYERLSFIEAVKRLAERARIPLELDSSPGAARSASEKESLRALHEQVAARWEQALATDAGGQVARDYLAGRGVDGEAIKRFRLGYAPEAWDDTLNWAKSKGHPLKLLEQAGLAVAGKSGGHYDRFRGRLMFPIRDEQGRVIGFSGRVLSQEQKGGKYVNSPETPIFNKSRVVYGLDLARRPILDAKWAVVCEGQLDTIACHMAGIENAVSPQGTVLTGEQTRILKRYAEEVVLCFDSDMAGQQAALRSLDDLLASGLAIRVAVIPEPHDPDSFIRETSGSAFRALLEGAPDFFDFLLDRLCRLHDRHSDRGRINIVAEMREAIQKTGDPVRVDAYAQKTGNRLGVDPDAVRAEFRKQPRRTAAVHPNEPAPAGKTPPMEKPPPLEFWLLKLLLLHDERVEWLEARLKLEWVRHPAVRQLIRMRFEMASNAWQGVSAMVGALEDAGLRQLAAEAASEARPIPDPDQQLEDVVTRLRDQDIDRRLGQVTHRLAEPGLSGEELKSLIGERQALASIKGQPLEPIEGD